MHVSPRHEIDGLGREPGENVVARSIEIGHPIIYVGINYREALPCLEFNCVCIDRAEIWKQVER